MVLASCLALTTATAWAWVQLRPEPGRPLGTGWFVDQVTTASEGLAVRVTAAQLDHLLAQRSTAVRSGSRRDFLAGVAPRTRPAEGAAFGRLGAVPFRSYTVSRQDPGSLQADTLRTAALHVPVRIDSRLDGDPAASSTRARASFRLDDGRWQLVSVVPRRPELWDLARVSMAQGEHSLALVAAGAGDVALLAAEVDAATRAVDAAWPLRWSARVVVELPADVDQLQQLVDRPGAGALAGVTSYRDDGDGPVVRVRLNPEVYRGMVPLARQILLRHEITHAAQYAQPYRNVPIWLIEGTAEYLGYAGSGVPDTVVAASLLDDVRDGRPPRALPGLEQFGFTRGEEDRRQAYELSWAASRAVVDRYGVDRLFAVYAAVLDADGPADRREQVALREVLGISAGQFRQLWQDWLRSRS